MITNLKTLKFIEYQLFMKKLAFLAFSFFASQTLFAQFVNNGGNITVQSGGYIFCSGDFQNNSGTVTNNGKVEVQGNFTNASRYASVGAEDSLILSGAFNSTLSSGNDTINYLVINKSTATQEVKILGTVKLGKGMNFTQGLVTTDPLVTPTALLSAPTSATFTFAAGKEIIGKVRRTQWTNSITPAVFNQAGMTVSTTGGTAPSDVTVNMIPQSAGGNPTLSQREIKRRFEFTNTGGTGFTASMNMPYLEAELNSNAEATIKPWSYDVSEWTGRLSGTVNTTTNVASITGVASADFAREWKLADARYSFNATALLRGPWSSGTQLLNNTLNTSTLIPLAQPYTAAPFSYPGTESVASIPNADVVDWVLVELRRPASRQPADASSSTIIGRKAGFILRNGSIVNPDGVTAISFDITKQDTSFLVIRHRNHLGVMSKKLPANESGSFTNDFTVLANVYRSATATTDPVVALAGSTTKFGLWAGDANTSGTIGSTDVSSVKASIAGGLGGYRSQDVNMDGNTNSTDVSLVKLMTANGGSGSVPAFWSGGTTSGNNNVNIESHLP